MFFEVAAAVPGGGTRYLKVVASSVSLSLDCTVLVCHCLVPSCCCVHSPLAVVFLVRPYRSKICLPSKFRVAYRRAVLEGMPSPGVVSGYCCIFILVGWDLMEKNIGKV